MFIAAMIFAGLGAAGIVTTAAFQISDMLAARKAKKESEELSRQASQRRLQHDVDSKAEPVDQEILKQADDANARAARHASVYEEAGLTGKELEGYALPNDTEAHKATMGNYDKYLKDHQKRIDRAVGGLITNPSAASEVKEEIAHSANCIDALNRAMDTRVLLRQKEIAEEIKNLLSPVADAFPEVFMEYPVDENGIMAHECINPLELKETLMANNTGNDEEQNKAVESIAANAEKLEELYTAYDKLNAVASLAKEEGDKYEDKTPNSVGEFALRDEVIFRLGECIGKGLITEEGIIRELESLPGTPRLPKIVKVGEEAVEFEKPYYDMIQKYDELLERGPKQVSGPTLEELQEAEAAKKEEATPVAKAATGVQATAKFQEYEVNKDLDPTKLSIKEGLLKEFFEKYPVQSPSLLRQCSLDSKTLKKIVTPVGDVFMQKVFKKDLERMAQRLKAIEQYSLPGLSAKKTVEQTSAAQEIYAEILSTAKVTVDRGSVSVTWTEPKSYSKANVMFSDMRHDLMEQLHEKFADRSEIIGEAVTIEGLDREVEQALKAMGLSVVKEQIAKNK